MKSWWKSTKTWLALFATVSIVGFIPVFSSWLLNRFQVCAEDLIVPLVTVLASSAVIAFVFYSNYKKNKFAAVFASASISLFIRSHYEQKLESITSWIAKLIHLQPTQNINWLVAFSCLFLIVIFICGKILFHLLDRLLRKFKWNINKLHIALLITVGIPFIIQTFQVARAIIIEWPQFSYKPPELETGPLSTDKGKPDIYYIVWDRYANKNVLEDQFGFDNSDFVDFLRNNNFYVQDNAMNNYPYTTLSISSTMNANYQTDIISKFKDRALQSIQPYHNSVQYAAVTKKLKSLGYSYYHLGTWYEATNKAPLADYYYQPQGQLYIFNKRITLNQFPGNRFAQGIFWRFAYKGLSIHGYKILAFGRENRIETTFNKIAILKNLANEEPGGRFIFAHFLVPHEPYYFLADGSINPNSANDNVGMPIKEKYINQVEFVNIETKEIVNLINAKSKGKAIIILQADEGPYPSQLNHVLENSELAQDEIDSINMAQWPTEDLEMKYGSLAAYHIPEASREDLAKGADHVNVFRLVFNTYFGANMAYLPSCYYAYPNGQAKPFVYEDITQILTGEKNPKCPSDSIFPK